MANLEQVIQNPDERKASVSRMMSDDFARKDVRANHGIKDQAELQERVCAPPFVAGSDDERTSAFERMLGALS